MESQGGAEGPEGPGETDAVAPATQMEQRPRETQQDTMKRLLEERQEPQRSSLATGDPENRGGGSTGEQHTPKACRELCTSAPEGRRHVGLFLLFS